MHYNDVMHKNKVAKYFAQCIRFIDLILTFYLVLIKPETSKQQGKEIFKDNNIPSIFQ